MSFPLNHRDSVVLGFLAIASMCQSEWLSVDFFSLPPPHPLPSLSVFHWHVSVRGAHSQCMWADGWVMPAMARTLSNLRAGQAGCQKWKPSRHPTSIKWCSRNDILQNNYFQFDILADNWLTNINTAKLEGFRDKFNTDQWFVVDVRAIVLSGWKVWTVWWTWRNFTSVIMALRR